MTDILCQRNYFCCLNIIVGETVWGCVYLHGLYEVPDVVMWGISKAWGIWLGFDDACKMLAVVYVDIHAEGRERII